MRTKSLAGRATGAGIPLVGGEWGLHESRHERPMRVELSEDREAIVWDWAPEAPSEKPAASPKKVVKGALREFIRLGERTATPEDFCDFASLYGPLYLSGSGRLFSPEAQGIPGEAPDKKVWQATAGRDMEERFSRFFPGWPSTTDEATNPLFLPSRREPLRVWRLWVQVVRSLMGLLIELKRGKRGRLEDWEALKTSLPAALAGGEPSVGGVLMVHRFGEAKDREAEWKDFLFVLNLLMQRTAVQPTTTWDAERGVTIEMHGLGSLSSVAAELAFAAVGSEAFAVCDGCGNPFKEVDHKGKVRKRAAGRRKFCADCGDGDKVAKRLSAQERRAEERAQRT